MATVFAALNEFSREIFFFSFHHKTPLPIIKKIKKEEILDSHKNN